MKRVLLFIFSSKPSEHAHSVRASLVWVLLGFCVALATFEVAVAAFISLPRAGKTAESSLVKYFNYGFNIQTKLDRAVGQKGQKAEPLIRAGWISTELHPPSDSWKTGTKRMIFYGMSFTNRISDAITRIDPNVQTLNRAGPAAPLSHSYALFQSDPSRPDATHIVVGILSSSIPYLQGMTGLGYTFENPAPYSYPQYTMIDGELKSVIPFINQRDIFISSYRKQSLKWQDHLAKIKAHDAYWDPLVFNRFQGDISALVRLLRRFWAARVINRNEANVYSKKDGYNQQHPSMLAVPEMLFRMQKASTLSGQKLIVILLHARGEPGHLNKWLSADLRAAGIKVISSSDLFSSRDFLNFEKDGHYLPRLDDRLAQSVIKFLGP